ncbi:hypothetical protein BJV82DRAFT_603573 [Fennellomyces sp. T-0311]|nr:hypothetical protein BJV82DRAFT_603573 [Fennellomyces sp. T-0311]
MLPSKTKQAINQIPVHSISNSLKTTTQQLHSYTRSIILSKLHIHTRPMNEHHHHQRRVTTPVMNLADWRAWRQQKKKSKSGATITKNESKT